MASARVSQMLNLRSVVNSMPLLAKALDGSRSQLLRIIREVRERSLSGATARRTADAAQMISDERLEKIEQLVSNSLNENTTLQKVAFISTD